MNINQASKKTGISKDMIRFYEKKGIIHPSRNQNNYRNYTKQDLNTLVLARQYSMMGIQLDTIASLFQFHDLDEAAKQLNQSIQKLEDDLIWQQARLQTAIEFQKLFTMIQDNIPFQTGTHIQQYFYPMENQTDSLTHMITTHGSIAKAVFRLPIQEYQNGRFVGDTGYLLPRIHPDSSLQTIIYPKHFYYRTIYRIPPNHAINLDDMSHLFAQAHHHGYQECGDVFIYEVSRKRTESESYDVLCIEFQVTNTKKARSLRLFHLLHILQCFIHADSANTFYIQ